MGSGFACPPFLSVLRQCISRGGPQTLSSSTPASAAGSTSTSMSFLVDHAMAVADPHYRPPPCDPAYAYGPTSDRLCNPPPQERGHSAHRSWVHPQPSVRALGDVQGAHHPGPSLSYPQAQENEWVAGPNGIRHRRAQGSASDRGRLGPSNPASEGDVVKLA